MGLNEHKKLLNKELDQFNSILGEILPRYILLMKKRDTTAEEEKELGDIEHFLIEINGKIAEIKNKLDQDLFGDTMNLYYKVKQEAIKGDPESIKRLKKIKQAFADQIQGAEFFNWN